MKPISLEIPKFESRGAEEEYKPQGQEFFHELYVGKTLKVQDRWEQIINFSLTFFNTPQGYEYWASLAFRGRPMTEDDIFLLSGLFEMPYGDDVKEEDIV